MCRSKPLCLPEGGSRTHRPAPDVGYQANKRPHLHCLKASDTSELMCSGNSIARSSAIMLASDRRTNNTEHLQAPNENKNTYNNANCRSDIDDKKRNKVGNCGVFVVPSVADDVAGSVIAVRVGVVV